LCARNVGPNGCAYYVWWAGGGTGHNCYPKRKCDYQSGSTMAMGAPVQAYFLTCPNYPYLPMPPPPAPPSPPPVPHCAISFTGDCASNTIGTPFHSSLDGCRSRCGNTPGCEYYVMWSGSSGLNCYPKSSCSAQQGVVTYNSAPVQGYARVCPSSSSIEPSPLPTPLTPEYLDVKSLPDCITSKAQWYEYEDWIADTGVRAALDSGSVVTDAVDNIGNRYDQVLNKHCRAVFNNTQKLLCTKDEVPVASDPTHLKNVRHLCKVHMERTLSDASPPPLPSSLKLELAEPLQTAEASPAPSPSLDHTSSRTSSHRLRLLNRLMALLSEDRDRAPAAGALLP